MKSWKEAASLILGMRPSQLYRTVGEASTISTRTAKLEDRSEKGGYTEDYKILMMRRSKTTSFPGKAVFPGGVIQKVDHSTGWVNLFKKITNQSLDEYSNMFHTNNIRPPIISGLRPWDVVPDVAFRICAIREMFEECGILLATRRLPEISSKSGIATKCHSWEQSTVTNVDPNLLKTWRDRVHTNSTEFLRMCHELEAFPNVWILENWRNWLTPVFDTVTSNAVINKPNRFDTLFYMACLDCEQFPETSADETEITHLEWKSPSEYISLLEETKYKWSVAPPQLYELQRMKLFPTLEQLYHYARVHGQEVMSCWMPVMKMCTDAVLIVLPGDHLYPAEADFEGTKVVTTGDPPVPLAQLMIDDKQKNIHRIVFKDSTLRNGRVFRNIASSIQ